MAGTAFPLFVVITDLLISKAINIAFRTEILFTGSFFRLKPKYIVFKGSWCKIIDNSGTNIIIRSRGSTLMKMHAVSY